ncbi:alpha/beta hydrolase [uncultured Gilliamella sp.]|uniref:alpha/beta hydrolase n=1 Tax=uncultured Gilliamella sp. TaxID=1193505 RepID=UPI0025E6F551|nr:alpha/beta hydrolase [uncultured Gilliamella sp.]
MTSTENLSEQIFKPQYDYPETSTLINRIDTENNKTDSNINNYDSDFDSCWYRIVTPILWYWRGLPTLEVEAVLSKIAVSIKQHSNNKWLDSVAGYQPGNWIYEFLNQAAEWQAKAESIDKADITDEDKKKVCNYYLIASEYCSIASYPHFKNDELALYAQTCAYQNYFKALSYSPFTIKELEFKVQNQNVKSILHLPQTEGACPVVIMCCGLSNLQIDFYRYFSEYLAQNGIAMLTVDIPSVGYSRGFDLTQNSSLIHQAILEQLPTIPWVDDSRVILAGFRFGSHIATRLAQLMPNKIKGLFNFMPLIHYIFIDQIRQKYLPNVYKDIFASRLGLPAISNQQLIAELNYFSLKNQGILTHSCVVPVMNVIFEDDRLSTFNEAKLIHSLKQNKLIIIPKSPLQVNLQNALEQSVKWMISIL